MGLGTPAFVSINRMRFGWQSSRFFADNMPLTGLIKITYSEKLDQEDVYDNTNDGTPVGYTYGQYSNDGFVLTFLKQDANSFTDYLALKSGRGWIGPEFAFAAQCDEPLTPGAIPITLNGKTCRVVERKGGYEKGIAALTEEFLVKALSLSENGKTLFDRARNVL
jgi:hypothetical protein